MIKYTEERLSPEVYIDFLKRTDLGSQYPKERFRERIGKLVRNVSISIVARDGDTIVGVLFGLTDFSYWLYVTDLYYREGFINGAYETKSFTVDEFVKAFSPSFGLPLWMDMMLLSYNDDGIHIKLDMSIRFRKTKDLCYKETGHPPIRVL